jgi:itaconyl-CoA hydratase
MLTPVRKTDRRIRATYGRYLEEFEVGDIYEHRPGRTITEADNIHFSLLTMNAHPMHCDKAFAAKSEFGQLLVNSGLSLAVVLGMTVNDVSAKAIANLGWTEIKLTGPVFCGDTLYAESEVLETRPSNSRPGQGLVRVRTRGYNQRDETVMTFERTVLVYTRDASPNRTREAGAG